MPQSDTGVSLSDEAHGLPFQDDLQRPETDKTGKYPWLLCFVGAVVVIDRKINPLLLRRNQSVGRPLSDVKRYLPEAILGFALN
jgi:hypothetical protein